MGTTPSRQTTYPGQRSGQRQRQAESRQQAAAPHSSSAHTQQPHHRSVPSRTTSQQQSQTSGNTSPVRFNASGDRLVVPGSHVPRAPEPTSFVSAGGGGGGGDFDRPGAFAVTRSASGPAQVFRVTVPPGVRPGAEFSVHAGSRRVRVRCPPNSHPGQSLQITLPPEPTVHSQLLKIAPLTAAEGPGGGGAVSMSPEVASVNRAAAQTGGTAQTFLVTIPPNIYPGMQFTVSVEGQRFMVTCPPNAGPNMKVRIVPPTKREEPEAAPKTQVFEVAVPGNVRPGQPFTLMANGQRVLVTCPPNVVPGQKIRFELPVEHVVSNISLEYEGNSGGWCRTIRVTDLKFQWVRVEKNRAVEDGAFDFQHAAYVRKLTFMEGNDARMRCGKLELVPASEATVDSKLVVNNSTILSYADIANVQGKSLEEKTKWFERICSQISGPWEEGHVQIAVRRSVILSDSVEAVMSLSREDMRKRWRLEFIGEEAIDAGGVTREWFELVSEEIFDPNKGLWLSSGENQMCMTINPASGVSCPDDHLVYFRFLGRIMGRALFDRQLIRGHTVRHIYKHLLGWPVTFEDLEHQDAEYYQSLKKLTNMDDVSMMCLDFTATEETMGVRTEVDLIEGGSLKEVTNDNLAQYLEANLQYRMLGRTKLQMTELLLGFFDIIPEAALSVFEYQELELMLCGLSDIDMDDWEANTVYTGQYEHKGSHHQVVRWFWQVVRNDFDKELRTRLLQFVTGTSGVPPGGFKDLQGNDGNIKKFAIHGISLGTVPYPRAHTCFNRIDLPNYESKKQLLECLKAAVLSPMGFTME